MQASSTPHALARLAADYKSDILVVGPAVAAATELFDRVSCDVLLSGWLSGRSERRHL
jgi:hypothetical protein